MVEEELLFHVRAINEARRYSIDVASLASAVHEAINGNLEETGGSSWKRLSTDWKTEYRLREEGSFRAICSVVYSASGRRLVFLHELGPRSSIYDAYDVRVEYFHRHIWDAESRERKLTWGREKYRIVNRTALSSGERFREELFQPTPRLFLTGEQRELVRTLSSPAQPTSPNGAMLSMVQGPPGSGKTVLAQEIALEAFGEQNCQTLVLVPSAGLYRNYESFLNAHGTPIGKFTPIAPSKNEDLWLNDVRDFFAELAGEVSRATAREPRLYEWWAEACKNKKLQDWVREYGIVGDRRTAQFIDALLVVNDEVAKRAKDSHDAQHSELYLAIDNLRLRRQTFQWLSDSRPDDLPFRSELADRAASRFFDRSDFGTAPLAVIVDEAQDLIPAEWQALVRWTTKRSVVSPTALLLLGDENQRIAPTAFSWDKVKTYAGERLGTRAKGAVSTTTLAGESFRLSREIAGVANLIMGLPAATKARTAPLADAQNQPSVERVQFLVDDRPLPDWIAIARTAARRLSGDGRLQVIAPSDETTPRKESRQRVDIRSATAVKGLEFDSVVVLHPFGSVTRARSANGVLDYDVATAAYTSVTRARKQLLCVIRSEDWNAAQHIERTTWESAGAEIQLASEFSKRQLQDMLAERANNTTADEFKATLQHAFDNHIDTGPDGTSTRHREKFVDLAVDLVLDAIPIGDLSWIVKCGEHLTNTFPWTIEVLQRKAHNAIHRLRTEPEEVDRAVSVLLLAGEIASARKVLQDSEEDLGEDREEILEDACLWEQWREHELADGARDFVPTELCVADRLCGLLLASRPARI